MKRIYNHIAACILGISLVICLSGCGGNNDEDETIDTATIKTLIQEYDSNGGKLSPEQYSELIKNTQMLLGNIKKEMKNLLGVEDSLAFINEYQRLKADSKFIESLNLREQVWRVLVLGQKDFSEENIKEFGNLPDESMLIDYYDDCIRTRITEGVE